METNILIPYWQLTKRSKEYQCQKNGKHILPLKNYHSDKRITPVDIKLVSKMILK